MNEYVFGAYHSCSRDETQVDFSSRSASEASKARTEAWNRVNKAHKDLLAEKGRLHRIKAARTVPRLRANYRVLVAAGRLQILLDRHKGSLGTMLMEPRRSLNDLPSPQYCRCGCGGLIPYADTGTGRPREFARAACRKKAFRRRQAHLPEFAPRVEPGGRMKLTDRLIGWTFNRFQMANMLTHDLELMRLVLRGKETANVAQLRNRLRRERQWAGLRADSLPKRSPFTLEYFARGLPVRRQKPSNKDQARPRMLPDGSMSILV